MAARDATALTPTTWLEVVAHAYALFDDLKAKGFGEPPFSMGGGTVLMLHYKHRLSRDVDFFAYDVQWLSLLTPRLNDKAAALSIDYSEQANSVKLVTAVGDIDFIVAGDVTCFVKTTRSIAGRMIPIDPPSEILAKKLFYRAAELLPRDVYDMSAAIDLAPAVAAEAARSAAPKRAVLMRRLDELADLGREAMLRGILPYDGPLQHSENIVGKVRDFLTKRLDAAAADPRTPAAIRQRAKAPDQ